MNTTVIPMAGIVSYLVPGRAYSTIGLGLMDEDNSLVAFASMYTKVGLYTCTQ